MKREADTEDNGEGKGGGWYTRGPQLRQRALMQRRQADINGGYFQQQRGITSCSQAANKITLAY